MSGSSLKQEKPARWGLRTRMFVISGAFAVLITGTFAVRTVAIQDLHEANRLTVQAQEVTSNAVELEVLTLNLQTGIRGFLITDKERFLSPWKQARRQLPFRINRLNRAIRNPNQKRAALRIENAVRAYSSYLDRLVVIGRRDLERGRSVTSRGEGERRVNAIRLQFKTFLQSQSKIQASRSSNAKHQAQRAITLGIVGVIGSLLLFALLTRYLQKLVVEPVRRMVNAARKIAKGDLTVRLSAQDKAEMAELSEAFNLMAESLEDSQSKLHASNNELKQKQYELKRATNDAQRQANFTHAVLDKTHDAFVSVNEQGHITDWNDRAKEIFGWEKEEAVGRRMTTALVPDRYRAAYDQAIERFLATGEASAFDRQLEVVGIRRDGSEFSAELTISPLKWEGTYSFHAFVRDISERKKASEALREAEERFRKAFDNAPIGSALISINAEFKQVNNSLCVITGYDESELLSRKIVDITHPDDVAKDMEAIKKMLTGELDVYRAEKRYIHRSGRTVWVSINAAPVTDQAGQPLYLTAQIQDITQRKLTEQYTDAQHAVTQLLAESSSSEGFEDILPKVLATLSERLDWQVAGFWNIDNSSHQLACQAFWHADQTQAMQKFVDASKKARLDIGTGLPGRVWKTRQPAWIENVVEDRNFPRAPFAETAKLHTAVGLPISSGNKMLGVLEFFDSEIRTVDRHLIESMMVTSNQIGQFIERKRAERESERLKDEFFGLVSHELRTPLTSILGYLELILEGETGALPEDTRNALETVTRNSRRLLRLVGDLLFLTQIQRGKFALSLHQTDLAQVVTECISETQPMADRNHVHLRAKIDPTDPYLGDHDRLVQVLINLITNALKFTPEGGSVEVKLQNKSDRAVLEVKDTGVGIPASEQDRLFERFFRSSSAVEQIVPGVGLGLSIAKAIVDAHGGRISLESEENIGTTFRVEFPFKWQRVAIIDATNGG